MKAHVTLFANVKATDGTPNADTWPNLISGSLESQAKIFHLWTPARLTDDKRLAENVREVYALVLDFDGKDKRFVFDEESNQNPPIPPNIEEVLERWPMTGWWHYTRSHTEEYPCFRLVLPLDEGVSVKEHSDLYQLAIERENRLSESLSSLDEHCSDPARLWYLPKDPGAWNEVHGRALDRLEWEGWKVGAQKTKKPAPKFDPEKEPSSHFHDASYDESRIAAYLSVMPPAIAGQGGHTATYNAARKVVDFGVSDVGGIVDLLEENYNPRCSPPWSRKELEHKAKEALKSRVRNPIPTQQSTSHTVEFSGEMLPPGYKAASPDKLYGALIADAVSGRILNRLHNYVYLIHQSFASSIRFDDFLCKLRVTGPLPWELKDFPRDWSDVDGLRMCAWLERTQNIAASPERTHSAVTMVGEANKFDSYIDHLKSLPVWDGVPRLDQWLQTYLGVSDTDYTRQIGRAFLIAMVARGMVPGVEVHNVLVLEGSQGIGKSRAARILAGSDEWFTSAIPDLQSKDAAISLQGKVIAEIAELAAMKRSNNESAKEFITRSHDKYRPPFGRNEINRPRRCVFIATTNHSTYLTDETGNRRYWPVRCSSKTDLNLMARERNQLLSEAKVAFEGGEKWYSKILDSKAFVEQRKRNESDPWDDDIDSYIAHKKPRAVACPDQFVDFVSSNELLSNLGVDTDKRNVAISRRVSRMMRARGWSPTRIEKMVNGVRKQIRGFSFTRAQQAQVIMLAKQRAEEAIKGAENNGEAVYEIIDVDEPEHELDESRGSDTVHLTLDRKSLAGG